MTGAQVEAQVDLDLDWLASIERRVLWLAVRIVDLREPQADEG